MTTTTVSSTSHRPAAVRTMYVGLALTLIALIFPFIDRAVTRVSAGHIQHGYPSYSQSQIDQGVTVYLIILSVIGVLGVASWLLMIWAANRAKRWARWTAAAIFAGSAMIGLSGLLITDTSGEVGLAPLLAWLVMLPSAAGLVAVVQLWRSGGRR